MVSPKAGTSHSRVEVAEDRCLRHRDALLYGDPVPFPLPIPPIGVEPKQALLQLYPRLDVNQAVPQRVKQSLDGDLCREGEVDWTVTLMRLHEGCQAALASELESIRDRIGALNLAAGRRGGTVRVPGLKLGHAQSEEEKRCIAHMVHLHRIGKPRQLNRRLDQLHGRLGQLLLDQRVRPLDTPALVEVHQFDPNDAKDRNLTEQWRSRYLKALFQQLEKGLPGVE
jgi:hypothetical protein